MENVGLAIDKRTPEGEEKIYPAARSKNIQMSKKCLITAHYSYYGESRKKSQTRRRK